MKEFKGTKGKWFPNVISTITIGVNAEIERNKVGVYSQNVCEFILPDTDSEYETQREEIEANAQLISAAPELLEALQKSLPLMEELRDEMENSGDGVDKDIERAIKVSKQAINKALGQ